MICSYSELLKIRNDIEFLGYQYFGGSAKSFVEDILSGFGNSHYVVFYSSNGSELTGYLIISNVCDESEIIQIAVKDEFKRAGIATSLLHEAFEYCRKQKIISAFLEVRASNPGAIAFYEKNGFRKTGIRKKYYESPVEDAVMMKKDLSLA